LPLDTFYSLCVAWIDIEESLCNAHEVTKQTLETNWKQIVFWLVLIGLILTVGIIVVLGISGLYIIHIPLLPARQTPGDTM